MLDELTLSEAVMNQSVSSETTSNLHKKIILSTKWFNIRRYARFACAYLKETKSASMNIFRFFFSF